jgi:hypothetical protein
MIASDEPCVRAPVVSPGRVEEVGQHADAALLDLRGLRILGVIDEVAVQVLGDDPLRLGLHPRRHERRQVALRDAVEDSSSPISRIASTARMPCSEQRCRARARAGSGCRSARELVELRDQLSVRLRSAVRVRAGESTWSTDRTPAHARGHRPNRVNRQPSTHASIVQRTTRAGDRDAVVPVAQRVGVADWDDRDRGERGAALLASQTRCQRVRTARAGRNPLSNCVARLGSSVPRSRRAGSRARRGPPAPAASSARRRARARRSGAPRRRLISAERNRPVRRGRTRARRRSVLNR